MGLFSVEGSETDYFFPSVVFAFRVPKMTFRVVLGTRDTHDLTL